MLHLHALPPGGADHMSGNNVQKCDRLPGWQERTILRQHLAPSNIPNGLKEIQELDIGCFYFQDFRSL